jgi:hypothetical protein
MRLHPPALALLVLGATALSLLAFRSRAVKEHFSL